MKQVRHTVRRGVEFDCLGEIRGPNQGVVEVAARLLCFALLCCAVLCLVLLSFRLCSGLEVICR